MLNFNYSVLSNGGSKAVSAFKIFACTFTVILLDFICLSAIVALTLYLIISQELCTHCFLEDLIREVFLYNERFNFELFFTLFSLHVNLDKIPQYFADMGTINVLRIVNVVASVS